MYIHKLKVYRYAFVGTLCPCSMQTMVSMPRGLTPAAPSVSVKTEACMACSTASGACEIAVSL